MSNHASIVSNNVIAFGTVFLNVVWAVYFTNIIAPLGNILFDVSQEGQDLSLKVAFNFTSISSIIFLLISPIGLFMFIYIMSHLHNKSTKLIDKDERFRTTFFRKSKFFIPAFLVTFWLPIGLFDISFFLGLHVTLFTTVWLCYLAFWAE